MPEDLELVVVSKEKPTSFLINEILEVLSELQDYSTARYEDYLYVHKRPTETSNEGEDVAVYITFTSAAFYPPDGTGKLMLLISLLKYISFRRMHRSRRDAS